MADEAHTIPDHIADRAARLINEAEDMRQQAADDLKQIYADLREELRGMGWKGAAVSTEVAAFKGAISEMRMDEAAKEKREEKSDRSGYYISMLSRARARKGQSYAEVKGAEPRGFIASLSPEQKAAALAYRGDDTHGAEPTQEQPETASQSVQSQDAAVVSEYAGTSSDENPAPAHKTAEDSRSQVTGDMDRGSRPVGGPTHPHSPAQAPHALQADKTSEAVVPPAASLVAPSAMNAKTKGDVIRLLRPFCQHADDLQHCGGQSSKHCNDCEQIKRAAQVSA